MRYVEKQATLAEVMEHVTLADCGRMAKVLAINAGCFGLFALIGVVGGSVVTATVPSVNIPIWVWTFGLSAAYLLMFQGNGSYHDWSVKFWFPKLGWLGFLIVPAYFTGCAYAFRSYGWWAGWLALSPGLLFVDLCQTGYWRLMAIRNGETTPE